MSRPVRRVIASGIAAWDGDVDANFDAITGAPFPVAQYATTGALPAASSYDQCLALVVDVLYISNGSTWEVYQQSANVPDSTAVTAADMASDFNDLLSALQTAGIMASS